MRALPAARIAAWADGASALWASNPASPLRRSWYLGLMAALMSGGGVMWTGLAVALGLWKQAVFPFAYVVVSALNLAAARRTGDLEVARAVQIAVSVALPFAFQTSLGGIQASGCMMLWAFVAMVGALTSARPAVAWTVLFTIIVLTGASALIEPYAAALPAARVVDPIGAWILALNVTLVATITFGILSAHVDEMAQRGAALEVANNDNVALNQRLASTVADLVDSQVHLQTTSEQLRQSLLDVEAAHRKLLQKEKLASMGSLVGGIAHELNTPLGVALTAASLLQERLQTVPAGRGSIPGDAFTALDMCTENLKHAAALVRSFKAAATDHGQTEPQAFELHAYVADMMAVVVASSARDGVAALCPRTGPVDVVQRAGPVATFVRHVVVNALTHAFPGGRRGVVLVRVTRTGANVEISVSDDGVGMTESFQKRAFDPFFTSQGGAGGAGLGMFVVHEAVVTGLGGTVTLTSRVGHGTVVKAVFPARVTDGAGAP